MPIAIACLRLFTFRRPPDFNCPCLYSCITLPTFFCAFLPYLRCPELLELLREDELERRDFFAELEREVLRCEVLLGLRWLLLLLRLWLAELRRRLPLVFVLRERLELPRRLELDFRAVAIKSLASAL